MVHELTEKYFDYAIKEIDSAYFLQEMEPPPLEIICYLCKSGVSKLLYSFLISEGIENVNDLNLLQSFEKCIEIEHSFNEISTEVQVFLDCPVNLSTPESLDIDQGDMKLSIVAANKIKNFIEEKLKID